MHGWMFFFHRMAHDVHTGSGPTGYSVHFVMREVDTAALARKSRTGQVLENSPRAQDMEYYVACVVEWLR
jgi:folate-dependent phosphoribosylglycinamide formyltransferase PurN